MPNTIADYEKATGKKVNVNDPKQNIAVAIWQLNRLGEAEWVNKYEGMTTNPQVDRLFQTLIFQVFQFAFVSHVNV